VRPTAQAAMPKLNVTSTAAIVRCHSQQARGALGKLAAKTAVWYNDRGLHA
jgi:hypothetical protein